MFLIIETRNPSRLLVSTRSLSLLVALRGKLLQTSTYGIDSRHRWVYVGQVLSRPGQFLFIKWGWLSCFPSLSKSTVCHGVLRKRTNISHLKVERMRLRPPSLRAWSRDTGTGVHFSWLEVVWGLAVGSSDCNRHVCDRTSFDVCIHVKYILYL